MTHLNITNMRKRLAKEWHRAHDGYKRAKSNDECARFNRILSSFESLDNELSELLDIREKQLLQLLQNYPTL